MGCWHAQAERGRRPYSGPELSAQELWLNLWSHAVYDLGISEDRFWKLSLRQLGELTDRFDRRMEREGTLFGILASATANWSFSAPQEPRQPADFVPGLKRAPGIEDIPDDVAATQIDAFFGAMVKRSP